MIKIIIFRFDKKGGRSQETEDRSQDKSDEGKRENVPESSMRKYGELGRSRKHVQPLAYQTKDL